jgi:branched-chain amino acid transport system substrate-binding protein
MSASTRLGLLAALMTAILGGVSIACADILIGVAIPLTGELAFSGEALQRATELAAAEFNEKGGLLGQKVAITAVDDHCDGGQAVAAARKLVDEKTVAVIGHTCSVAAIPASEVYEAARIPFITAQATNPKLTERGLRFTFRAQTRDDKTGPFAAEYIVKRLGAKHIAIVHDTLLFGMGVAEAVRRRLHELGTPEVLFETVQPGQLEFGDLVAEIREAAAEVVYYGGFANQGALLCRQLREAGVDVTMVGPDSLLNDDYLAVAGPTAEGTLAISGPFFFGRPEAQPFITRFREATKSEPVMGGALPGYWSFQILAQAIEAAHTTEGGAIADALHREAFEVFGIRVSFDEKGDARGPMGEPAMRVWRGRSFVLVE